MYKFREITWIQKSNNFYDIVVALEPSRYATIIDCQYNLKIL